MNLAIHEAFLSADHKVAGVRLRPYSAAHAFTLEAIGWNRSHLASPGGFVRFLAVCSQPVGADCTVRPKAGLWLSLVHIALHSKKVRERAILQAVEYLKDHCSTPQIYAPEGGKSLSGNDILYRVVKGVRTGLSEARAWSMPIGALNTWLVHHSTLADAEAGRNGPTIADPSFENEVNRRLKELEAKRVG